MLSFLFSFTFFWIIIMIIKFFPFFLDWMKCKIRFKRINCFKTNLNRWRKRRASSAKWTSRSRFKWILFRMRMSRRSIASKFDRLKMCSLCLMNSNSRINHRCRIRLNPLLLDSIARKSEEIAVGQEQEVQQGIQVRSLLCRNQLRTSISFMSRMYRRRSTWIPKRFWVRIELDHRRIRWGVQRDSSLRHPLPLNCPFTRSKRIYHWNVHVYLFIHLWFYCYLFRSSKSFSKNNSILMGIGVGSAQNIRTPSNYLWSINRFRCDSKLSQTDQVDFDTFIYSPPASINMSSSITKQHTRLIWSFLKLT